MAINRTSPKKGKVVDIPTVPTIGTATAGGESATVEFTAATRGGPATTYTALSNPGSVTGTGSSSPVTVQGLTADTAYTFTVRGSNATGNGEYSAASNSVTPFVSTAFESIQTVTVGSGGTASVSFTSIPSTYQHLQIRGIGRTTNSGTIGNPGITFNADTNANNYTLHILYGDGSSAAALGGGAGTGTDTSITTGSTAGANIFGVAVIDILDYASTNKYKTVRSLTGADLNGSGTIRLYSNLWMNTSAITSITLKPSASASYSEYSQLALYGIKG